MGHFKFQNMKTENEIIANFKAALNNGDVATLQYMLSFTDRFDQMARNIRSYEQYLACGYTDKPTFDKYGWIDNDKKLNTNVESLTVFDDGRQSLNIQLLCLANGKWVEGINIALSESGYVGGAGIWGTQFPTRHDALIAALKHALKIIQSSSCKADLKYIKVVKNKIIQELQPSFF